MDDVQLISELNRNIDNMLREHCLYSRVTDELVLRVVSMSCDAVDQLFTPSKYTKALRCYCLFDRNHCTLHIRGSVFSNSNEEFKFGVSIGC